MDFEWSETQLHSAFIVGGFTDFILGGQSGNQKE